MDLLLHDTTKSLLADLVKQPKGSYIFHGPGRVGKRTAATWVATRLACSGQEGDNCQNCVLMGSGSHPDLLVVELTDKAKVGIGQIQELQHWLPLSRHNSAGRRTVIIDSADTMTPEAQNALLKAFEEPPAGTTIILIADLAASLLPTVRSRAYEIFFPRLPATDISGFLARKHNLKPVAATALAAHAEGQIGVAVTLAGDSDAAAQYTQAADLATELAGASPFERLVAASKVAESEGLPERLVAAIIAMAEAGARQGAGTVAARQLEAVERFWRQRSANVATKLALEGLLLEL